MPATIRQKLARVESDHIRNALARHQGNVAATARALGMNIRTLWSKITKHKIKLSRYRK